MFKKRTFDEYMDNPIRTHRKEYKEFFQLLWQYDNRIDCDEWAEGYWRDYWEEALDNICKKHD